MTIVFYYVIDHMPDPSDILGSPPDFNPPYNLLAHRGLASGLILQIIRWANIRWENVRMANIHFDNFRWANVQFANIRWVKVLPQTGIHHVFSTIYF